jgi:hypothetical protein
MLHTSVGLRPADELLIQSPSCVDDVIATDVANKTSKIRKGMGYINARDSGWIDDACILNKGNLYVFDARYMPGLRRYRKWDFVSILY